MFQLFRISAVAEIKLFTVFPESKLMLEAWAKENIENLASDKAREHVVNDIIPECRNCCNSEISDEEYVPLNNKEFLELLGLKVVNMCTVW